MTKNLIKIFVIAILTISMLALINIKNNSVSAFTLTDDDTAQIYKTKCLMCHKATAEQYYKPETPMEDQIKAILEGKQGEKIKMTGYKDKGIDETKAKALAEYMKALRTPSN